MPTTTPNFGLRKPTNSDTVNVALDIAGNMDLIDAHAHSGTYVALVPAPTGAAVTDTATLQAAVASGAKELILSAGTYLINAVVAATASMAVRGQGTTIRSTSGSHSLMSVSGVDGFTIDGVAFSTDYPTKTQGSGLTISSSQNVRVRNCRFTDIPEHAIGLTNVQKAWIQNNYIKTCGHSGVRLHNPGGGNHNDDIWIEDNYVENTQQAGAAGNAGIQTHGTLAVGTHRRITVARNRVINSKKVGIGLDTIDDSTVHGNIIVMPVSSSTGEGIAFTGSGNVVSANSVTGGGTDAASCILLWAVIDRANDHNKILDNICTNGGQGVAFVWGDTDAAITDLLVRGNTCYGNNIGIQSYFNGATAGEMHNISVILNYLIGNTTSAINLLSAPGSYQTFGNVTLLNDIRIRALLEAPFDGVTAQNGTVGSATTQTAFVNRHLDSTSGGNPEVRYEGRFDATAGVKAGGLGVRRSGNAAETFLYAYNGSASVESAKARSDGSFEVEGTGLWNGQHLVMGGYHLWLDSNGRLRAKSSTPASETDGSALLLAETFGPQTADPRTLTTAVTATTNQGYYMRARGAGLISKVGVNIGVSSGNICVAVYANNGSNGRAARPAARLATSGSVASPGTGYQEIALGGSVYFNDGDWLYVGADNATVSFFRFGTNGAAGATGDGLSHFQAAAFPAPATATPVAGTSTHSMLLLGVA